MTDTMRKIYLFFEAHRKVIFAFCFALVMFVPTLANAVSFGPTYDPTKYLEYCKSTTIANKYGPDSCWWCDIIEKLMFFLTEAAERLTDSPDGVIALGSTVLLIGSALWLAAYFLKTLSSFAAQDSAKVIDGLLTFMFKVAFIYVLINLGIEELVKRIINPLLGIGMDIALSLDSFSSGGSGGGSFGVQGYGLTSLEELKLNVAAMARMLHSSSAKMLQFADMLVCNARHGEASYQTFSIVGIVDISIHLIALDIFISGIILYALGFFIMMMTAFYMFDVAFNIALAMVLLPLGLALWPFGWTKDKLKIVIESIAHYTGLFIFLPLGIAICVEIVEQALASFATDASNTIAAQTLAAMFDEDNSDFIRDNLGVFTIGFLKVLLCYLVAFKVIPLMANDFCDHFFSKSLAGNPIADKLKQGMEILKQHTVGRVGNYTKDVAKHQTGNMVKSMGNKDGNLLDRAMYRYGKKLGNTKKR